MGNKPSQSKETIQPPPQMIHDASSLSFAIRIMKEIALGVHEEKLKNDHLNLSDW